MENHSSEPSDTSGTCKFLSSVLGISKSWVITQLGQNELELDYYSIVTQVETGVTIR